MSINPDHKPKKVPQPPRHWPPFMTAADACAYLQVSDKGFRKWIELAEIEKVPYINRYKKEDLDQIGTRLEARAAREASLMLSALNSKEIKKIS